MLVPLEELLIIDPSGWLWFQAVKRIDPECPSTYENILDEFIQYGKIPDAEEDASPLVHYVINLLNTPFIQIKVLTNPILAAYFKESTMWFIMSRIKQINFQRQCAQSEVREICTAYQYSPSMRGRAWQSLVKKVDAKLGDYGFNKKFMESILDNGGALEEDKWNKLIVDWTAALNNKLNQEESKTINNTNTFNRTNIVTDNMKSIEEYEKSSHIENLEAFEQSIIAMHGMWNQKEYDKMASIVARQKNYSSAIELVNNMGRHYHEDGNLVNHAEAGDVLKIPHAQGSDIEGISTSKSLSSLLPHELVCFTDNQLRDIFIQKYIQGTLQTFKYISKISKPTRRLTPVVHSAIKGPMVVCLDTSESMKGKPSQIAQSLLMRIIYEAKKNHRACYLIYFSVDIEIVDLIKTPEFIKSVLCSGGTDPTKMMKEMIRVLNTNDNYIMADCLWISDFCMPLPGNSLMEQLESLKSLGSKFYAIKIGDYDARWENKIFNKMLKIDVPCLKT